MSLDQTFAALADRNRRAVVDLLRKKPHRAGELAERLRLSPPALSRHLRVLRKSGLIAHSSDDSDARAKVYSLCPEPFSALRTWVHEVEQLWVLELGAFKAHAEKTRRKKGTLS